MAGIIGMVSNCGLTIEAHCRNQPNKSELVLYKLLLLPRVNNWLERVSYFTITSEKGVRKVL